MLRKYAFDKGYCKHCASFYQGRFMCGIITRSTNGYDIKPGANYTIGETGYDDGPICILPDDVQERFRAEWGLEGETQRHTKAAFGDRDQMKKKRGRKKK